MKASQRYHSRIFTTVVMTIIIAVYLSIVLFAMSIAHGHDMTHPELNNWFASLRSGKGLCCDGSDALHLRDIDWETKDGHYWVAIPKDPNKLDDAKHGKNVDSMWVLVPDDAVITEPNRDGATMVWPLYGSMGASIRCFMPGSMT